jgi:hypothetical protein
MHSNPVKAAVDRGELQIGARVNLVRKVLDERRDLILAAAKKHAMKAMRG